jgi:TPR repeat protein
MRIVGLVAGAIAIIGVWLASPVLRADMFAGRDAYRNQQFETALKEFTASAKQKNPEAMFFLGRMHQGGFGVKKDIAKATAWFGKAAVLGHPESQKEYGAALVLGEGIEKDINEGLKWLVIAAEGGHEGAKEYAAQLTRYLPKKVVRDARIAARKWRSEQDKKSGSPPPSDSAPSP